MARPTAPRPAAQRRELDAGLLPELRVDLDALEGLVKVEGLITHRLPLADLAHAVELMQKQEAVKVYITP